MNKNRIFCRKRNALQKVAVVCLVVNILFLMPAGANPWYVAPSGVDDAEPDRGKSWSDPFATINHAVSVAGDAHVVYVTNNATYTLTDTITVTDDVVIRSWKGPAGETDRYGTVIDGDGQYRCFGINNSGAVIDGFTITNGFVSAPAGYGAGVFINASGGMVTNCLITGNILESRDANSGGAGAGLLGGSIWNSRIAGNTLSPHPDGSSLETGGGVLLQSVDAVVANSEIYGNKVLGSATHAGGAGAAIRIKGTIQNCSISNNTSASRGGGITVVGGRTNEHLIINCIISSNSAGVGGGGIYTRGGNPEFTDCRVVSNIATTSGGGGLFDSDSAGELENCEFIGNEATYGGGVYLRGDNVMRNCIVIENAGGVVAGVFMEHSSAMYNSLIARNTGGPGIRISGGTIYNCTLVDNETTSSSLAGGVRVYGQDAQIYNSVIWSNKWTGADDPSRDLSFHEAASFDQVHYTCSPHDVTVQGNITNHPLFVDIAAENYRLNPNSPCLNLGTNQNWMTNALDLDGYPRIDRHNRRVDMGCYERVTRGSVYRFW